MKISTIVVCQDRFEFLLDCVKSLDESAKLVEEEIEVTVVTSLDLIIKAKFCDVKILKSKIVPFNKAFYLNNGIKHAGNFDVLTVIDVDMVVSKDYYSKVISSVKAGNDYTVVSGHKLTEILSNSIAHKDYENINNESLKTKFPFIPRKSALEYPSQIAITSGCFDLFKKIVGGNGLYDERFFGWGGEDSVLSYLSRKLAKEKLINKIIIDDMWFHQYHEDKKNNTNKQLYCDICKEIDVKFNSFMESVI